MDGIDLAGIHFGKLNGNLEKMANIFQILSLRPEKSD